MNAIRFPAWILLAAFVSAGCASRLESNPLEGWKRLGSAYVMVCPFGQTIIDDYQNYVQALSVEEKSSADDFHTKFYESSDNQRAVEITVNLNGTRWKHVLIYDQKNTRIRVIKYASSRYAS